MAYDTFTFDKEKNMWFQNLAVSDINNPLQLVPIEIVNENKIHPIVEDVDNFDLAEEFWAMNISSDVKELLRAFVGDRIPAPSRYRYPIPKRTYNIFKPSGYYTKSNNLQKSYGWSVFCERNCNRV